MEPKFGKKQIVEDTRVGLKQIWKNSMIVFFVFVPFRITAINNKNILNMATASHSLQVGSELFASNVYNITYPATPRLQGGRLAVAACLCIRQQPLFDPGPASRPEPVFLFLILE